MSNTLNKMDAARRTFLVLPALVLLSSSSLAQIEVSTPAELDDVRENLAGEYVQVADIDLSGFTLLPIGKPFVDPFTGSFDGNGFKISGFTYDGMTNEESFVGLFGGTNGALLQNITLEDVHVTGENFAGGLVGYASNTTITSCRVLNAPGVAQPSSVLAHQDVGGLVGRTLTGTLVENCVSYADTHAIDMWSGSLIGHVHVGSTILDSVAYGDASGDTVVGGLCGNIHGSVVRRCFAYGDVAGNTLCGGFSGWVQVGPMQNIVATCGATGDVNCSGAGPAGGLVGYSDGGAIVENCLAHGTVATSAPNVEAAGGLIGLSGPEDSITNCYSAGLVSATGSGIGGLIGAKAPSAVVTSSYWDLQTSGQSGSDGGEGRTTSQMMMQATFVGWDFVTIWDIDEGFSYPYFLAP